MLHVFNEQKEAENYSSNLNENGITNTIVLLPKADGYRSRSILFTRTVWYLKEAHLQRSVLLPCSVMSVQRTQQQGGAEGLFTSAKSENEPKVSELASNSCNL